VSERRVCMVLGQHRSTPRTVPRSRDDEERLTADIIELARQYGEITVELTVTGDPRLTRPRVHGAQRAPTAVVLKARADRAGVSGTLVQCGAHRVLDVWMGEREAGGQQPGG
jgi:CRP-like cAMP-binding protein